MAAAVNSNAAHDTKYFDLHVTGLGYLGRVREVRIKRGSFLACSIGALRGDSSDGVEYTNFDVKVVGEEAIAIITALQKHVEAGDKVLIRFRIGDIYPETFVKTRGDDAGNIGVALKGRLLKVFAVRVNSVDYDLERFRPEAAEFSEEDIARMDALAEMHDEMAA